MAIDAVPERLPQILVQRDEEDPSSRIGIARKQLARAELLAEDGLLLGPDRLHELVGPALLHQGKGEPP
jgi:hypothetical protein